MSTKKEPSIKTILEKKYYNDMRYAVNDLQAKLQELYTGDFSPCKACVELTKEQRLQAKLIDCRICIKEILG